MRRDQGSTGGTSFQQQHHYCARSPKAGSRRPLRRTLPRQRCSHRICILLPPHQSCHTVVQARVRLKGVPDAPYAPAAAAGKGDARNDGAVRGCNSPRWPGRTERRAISATPGMTCSGTQDLRAVSREVGIASRHHSVAIEASQRTDDLPGQPVGEQLAKEGAASPPCIA